MASTRDIVNSLGTILQSVVGISQVYTAPPRSILKPDLPAVFVDVEESGVIAKGLGNNYQRRTFKIYLYVAPIEATANMTSDYNSALDLLDAVLLRLTQEDALNIVQHNASLETIRQGENTVLMTDSGVVRLYHHDKREYWGAIVTVVYKYPLT